MFSSPEPKAHKVSLWDGHAPSSVDNDSKDLLLRNRLANQSQTSCEASLGWGNKSLYNWSRTPGHMTKMAAMAINSKNL